LENKAEEAGKLGGKGKGKMKLKKANGSGSSGSKKKGDNKKASSK